MLSYSPAGALIVGEAGASATTRSFLTAMRFTDADGKSTQ